MNRVLACALLGFAAAVPSYARAQTIRALTPVLVGHSVGGVTIDALGNLYVADFGEQVFKISPEGDLQPFATGLYGASGNAVDRDGNLLQSSFYGHSVIKFNRRGEVVRTYSAGLSGPVGIAVDQGADVAYVADCRANTIVRITPDGDAREFARSGLFKCPNGIVLGPGKQLFVTNFRDNSVLEVAPDGGVKLFAHVSRGGLGHVCFKSDHLYITAYASHEIYELGMDGKARKLLGSGERGLVDGDATAARLTFPNGIACDPYHEKLFINEYVGETGESLPRRAVVREVDL